MDHFYLVGDKYNEGELVGKRLSLSATQEDINDALEEVEINRIHYDQYLITDFDSSIEGSGYIG